VRGGGARRALHPLAGNSLQKSPTDADGSCNSRTRRLITLGMACGGDRIIVGRNSRYQGYNDTRSRTP
jgi:hypothetical protein